ncbi:MAG: CYTH domain-containing protein [Oscillospiraceae bacterium]|nr:CYTH domain-containing protein [Oscillospiraceae bacterium]
MSKEIENEFKIMLTKAEYEQILAMYEFDKIVQTNHYFDTDELEMSAKHTTVRVRELGDKYFLQVKLPTEVRYSRVEFCEELDGISESISSKRLKSLTGADFPDVCRLGTLKTTRNIHKFDGGEIDLDCSEYFDVIDYELEIEFSDELKARAVLDEIRARIGIQPSAEVCSGKLHRFLARFKEST